MWHSAALCFKASLYQPVRGSTPSPRYFYLCSLKKQRWSVQNTRRSALRNVFVWFIYRQALFILTETSVNIHVFSAGNFLTAVKILQMLVNAASPAAEVLILRLPPPLLLEIKSWDTTQQHSFSSKKAKHRIKITQVPEKVYEVQINSSQCHMWG